MIIKQILAVIIVGQDVEEEEEEPPAKSRGRPIWFEKGFVTEGGKLGFCVRTTAGCESRWVLGVNYVVLIKSLNIGYRGETGNEYTLYSLICLW